MDLTAITTVLASLDFIRKGLAAAVEVRDFNAVAAEVAKLNEALIGAQSAVLTQNSTLFALQKENLELAKELAKLKEALAQRGRYVLTQLSPGVFVYRVKETVVLAAEGDPVPAEPEHFVCQDCFDNRGQRVILQRHSDVGDVTLDCGSCKTQYRTGEFIPYPEIAVPGSDFY